MAFRSLAIIFSLSLAASCKHFVDDYYYLEEEGQLWHASSLAQIEESHASNYAVVSPNYHLVKLECTGCSRKLAWERYGGEYLVGPTRPSFNSLLPSSRGEISPQC
jgi:hypothetical protein